MSPTDDAERAHDMNDDVSYERSPHGERPPQALWDRWLQLALLAVIAYSAVLVVDGGTAGRFFELLGFGLPPTAIPTGDPIEQHLLLVYGVLGSVIIGWMTTLLLIARGPLRYRDRHAWSTFTVSFATWFTIDTTFSLAIGEPTHAMFNVAFVLLVAPPLAAMRSQLTPSPMRHPTTSSR